MHDITNDNDYTAQKSGLRASGAHGQAALLLVESLIHGLMARSILTVAEAVEIVDIAAEVKADDAADAGELDDSSQQSLYLIHNVAKSLRADLNPR